MSGIKRSREEWLELVKQAAAQLDEYEKMENLELRTKTGGI